MRASAQHWLNLRGVCASMLSSVDPGPDAESGWSNC